VQNQASYITCHILYYKSTNLPNYSITSGRLTENNEPHSFQGSHFVAGDSLNVQDAVALNVNANTQAEQNVQFNIGLSTILSPADSTKAGIFQVDGADWFIPRQLRC
jgi:hypothetical protein